MAISPDCMNQSNLTYIEVINALRAAGIQRIDTLLNVDLFSNGRSLTSLLKDRTCTKWHLDYAISCHVAFKLIQKFSKEKC